ncbi:MAG: polysaccharide biosynthesis protein [Firmicutes bacterium]|nr:polysaccharide biosynthesis protein [Bacillota bacterium]
MKPTRKHLLLLLIDIALLNAALWFSFFLRYEGRIPLSFVQDWGYLALVMTAIRIACFVAFGLYLSLWSYSSLPELLQILKAVLVSSVLQYVINYLLDFGISRSIFIIDFGVVLILTGGARLAIRMRRELLTGWESRQTQVRRVLVVGAGYTGALIIREMLREHTATHRPVAVLDDDPNKLFRQLHGVPIAGKLDQLAQVSRKYNVDEILVAMPSAPKSRLREIVNQAKKTGLPVRILPGILAMANGEISFNQAREVQIEDLLGRKPVRVDLAEIARYLQGERILVTGAGGSIGSELCRQISSFSPEILLLLGRGENSIYEIDLELSISHPAVRKKALIADIRDRMKMERIFREYRPTVVFHAAAHKHVPLMEDAPDEAVKNNIFGTKNLAELANEYGVKRFVLISTDKAVNPTSVMGATKRVAEKIVQCMAKHSQTKYCAVRFGNVLGSRGSVVPLFQKQIAAGGPVTITHPEMTRYLMTIPEAVSLVIQAGAMEENGEIFILDMGEPVRIVDLARDLIRFSGLEPDQDIKIQYCGVRPGEKIYEELLTAEEGVVTTKHERIYVSTPPRMNWAQFRRDLLELEELLVSGDWVKMTDKLWQIINEEQQVAVWKETAGSRLES